MNFLECFLETDKEEQPYQSGSCLTSFSLLLFYTKKLKAESVHGINRPRWIIHLPRLIVEAEVNPKSLTLTRNVRVDSWHLETNVNSDHKWITIEVGDVTVREPTLFLQPINAP